MILSNKGFSDSMSKITDFAVNFLTVTSFYCKAKINCIIARSQMPKESESVSSQLVNTQLNRKKEIKTVYLQLDSKLSSPCTFQFKIHK